MNENYENFRKGFGVKLFAPEKFHEISIANGIQREKRPSTRYLPSVLSYVKLLSTFVRRQFGQIFLFSAVSSISLNLLVWK